MKNRRHQACLAWSDARDTRRFGIEVWARGENRVGVKTRSLTRGKNKKKKRRIGTEAPPGPNANHFFSTCTWVCHDCQSNDHIGLRSGCRPQGQRSSKCVRPATGRNDSSYSVAKWSHPFGSDNCAKKNRFKSVNAIKR